MIMDAVVYIPLEELVDRAKEKERLQKEVQRLEKELARSKGMLGNERFLSKAPESKVQEEKDKLLMDEKMSKRDKQIKESNEFYNSDPKPGSIAAKARMVQKFNEKHK